MGKRTIEFDEFGVFVIADSGFLSSVAGGDVSIYVTTGLSGIFGGDLGCQEVTVPTDAVDLGLNWRCRRYSSKTEETYNVACTSTAGGLNPVCFNNAVCM